MPKSIQMKPEHVALLLTVRHARTEKGRAIQAVVLFRVECAMWIDSAIQEGAKS